MPEKNWQELHLTIHGSVQGVNFRWYTAEQARRLGLVGWVRNNPDGTVSILAQGEKLALEKLRAWCQDGPRGASVARVEEEWKEIGALDFSDFTIRFA